MESRFNHASPFWGSSSSDARPGRLRPVLVVLAALAAVACADDDTTTLSVDCVFCGPGQPYPHDCPYLHRNPPPPPPPPPLKVLTDQTGQIYRRLLAVEGVTLPDLGSPTSLEQLDATLGELLGAVQQETSRCQREAREFQRDSDSAQRESNQLTISVLTLSAQIQQLKQQVVQHNLTRLKEQQDLTAARQELDHLQAAEADMREAIRQTRNRIFPRLREALDRGWILPPSSYREVPAPLPVVTTSTSWTDLPRHPELARAGPLASARLAVPAARAGSLASAKPAVPGRRDAGADATEDSVRQHLAELEGAGDRLRSAAAERAQASRTRENAVGYRDLNAWNVQVLQSRRIESAALLATAQQELAALRLKAGELAGRLDKERTKAIYEWVQWGIFQVLDKKTEELMAEAYGKGVNVGLLSKFRDLATATAQLGSDTLGVIRRFPETAVGRGASFDDLQRDLDEAKHKFGLDFISTYLGIPGPVLPYLLKEK